LGEIKNIVAWVSLLDQKVAWLVLSFTDWHNLSELNWCTWGGFLSEVDVVSINNDVLAKIGFAGKTYIMWY
jgi:hypothetical protein